MTKVINNSFQKISKNKATILAVNQGLIKINKVFPTIKEMVFKIIRNKMRWRCERIPWIAAKNEIKLPWKSKEYIYCIFDG